MSVAPNAGLEAEPVATAHALAVKDALAGAQGELVFDALPGTTLRSLVGRGVKPVKQFAFVNGLPATFLVPTAAGFSGPGGELVLGPALTQSTKAFKLKSMTLPDFGTYTVSIGGLSGEYGFVRLKGRLKVPRARTKHVMP